MIQSLTQQNYSILFDNFINCRDIGELMFDDFEETVDQTNGNPNQEPIEEPYPISVFQSQKLSGPYRKYDPVTEYILVQGYFTNGSPSKRWTIYNEEGDKAVYQYQTSSYRVGALCNDGTTSTATGRGACSWHGGVSQWLYKTETKRVFIEGTGQFEPIGSRHRKIRDQVFKVYKIPITNNQKEDQWRLFREAIKKNRSLNEASDLIDELEKNNKELTVQLEAKQGEMQELKKKLKQIEEQNKKLREPESNPIFQKVLLEKQKEIENTKASILEKQMSLLTIREKDGGQQQRERQEQKQESPKKQQQSYKEQQVSLNYSVDHSCQWPELQVSPKEQTPIEIKDDEQSENESDLDWVTQQDDEEYLPPEESEQSPFSEDDSLDDEDLSEDREFIAEEQQLYEKKRLESLQKIHQLRNPQDSTN